MAKGSLAAATQQVKLLVGMATTKKSKVDTVPEDDDGSKEQQKEQEQQSTQSTVVKKSSKSSNDSSKTPAGTTTTTTTTAKTKTKRKPSLPQQFPEDLRGQSHPPQLQRRVSNGTATKKKKAGSRKSVAVHQQKGEQAQKEDPPGESPSTTTAPTSNVSTASTSTSTSTTRVSSKERKTAPAASDPPVVTPTGRAQGSHQRKKSNSFEGPLPVPASNNKQRSGSPTSPPTVPTTRKVSIAKKGRTSSLRNAVEASKQKQQQTEAGAGAGASATGSNKVSSLKTALAASKQQQQQEEPTSGTTGAQFARKLSIQSDSNAPIRKGSPTAQKRKESLKTTRKSTTPSGKASTSQEQQHLDTSNRSNRSSRSARSSTSAPVQKRKDSLKAKSDKVLKQQRPNLIRNEGATKEQHNYQEQETSVDSRSPSPGAGQKRKTSLRSKHQQPPSNKNEVTLNAAELDTSTRSTTRSTIVSVQKRKASLKAKGKPPKSNITTTISPNGEVILNESSKDLDTSNRSTSSLPANIAGNPRTMGKMMKQQIHQQSPKIQSKQKLKMKKTPHPQSLQATKSKLRSRSFGVAQEGGNIETKRSSSLSPKRKRSAVTGIDAEQMTLSSSFHSTGNLLAVDDIPDPKTRHSRRVEGGSKSNLSAAAPAAPDPLLGTRPSRPRSPPGSDLETRLERQRLLDEMYFGTQSTTTDDEQLPAPRNSDGSITISSMLTLAPTPPASQASMPTLPTTEMDAKVTAASRSTRKLSASTSRMSTYAGDSTSSKSRARPSLAPNMLINSHSHAQGTVGSKSSKPTQPVVPTKKPGSLTFFGNPLVPMDIVEQTANNRVSKMNLMHHKQATKVLEQIRYMSREQLKVKVDAINSSGAARLPTTTEDSSTGDFQPEEQPELKALQLLKTAGSSTAATLSMTGYKGGELENQINHDRSLIVSPFYLRNHDNSMAKKRRLMCVFDGHASDGFKFAEHCQQLLPSLLSRKLSEALNDDGSTVDSSAAAGAKKEDEVEITKRVLNDAFITMDESSPHDATGGCTATVIYQQGHKIYIANTGDSRSCIAIYRRNEASHPPLTHQAALDVNGASTMSMGLGTICEGDDSIAKPVKVIYISREDKPDLPEERARLEYMGGEIVEAEKNKSSKVKFHGERVGKATATLSMSRSIGDSQFTDLGVIPDPIVDVVDLKELVEEEKESTTSSHDGEVDDICVFAFCASDGMMIESIGDAETVASDLAPSLFNDNGPYPLTACQNLVSKSAATWDRRNRGKFRDDITIAVTVLRAPPTM